LQIRFNLQFVPLSMSLVNGAVLGVSTPPTEMFKKFTTPQIIIGPSLSQPTSSSFAKVRKIQPRPTPPPLHTKKVNFSTPMPTKKQAAILAQKPLGKADMVLHKHNAVPTKFSNKGGRKVPSAERTATLLYEDQAL